MKLLVLIIDKYQEIEVYGFLGALNRSQKLEKITYWNPDGATKVQGSNKIGFIETINSDINPEDYDAIYAKQVIDTAQIINKILATTDFEKEVIYFNAIW